MRLWSNPFHPQSLNHSMFLVHIYTMHSYTQSYTHVQQQTDKCSWLQANLPLISSFCSNILRHAVGLGSSFGEALGFKSVSLFFLVYMYGYMHGSRWKPILFYSIFHPSSLPFPSTVSLGSLLPVPDSVHLPPFVSIHPSVSWQKMSHASSWEAKTLSPSFPLNISLLYFSSTVFLSLFRSFSHFSLLCVTICFSASLYFVLSVHDRAPSSSFSQLISHVSESVWKSYYHFCYRLYFEYNLFLSLRLHVRKMPSFFCHLQHLAVLNTLHLKKKRYCFFFLFLF